MSVHPARRIAAPPANWSRATALAIEGSALIVALATARERQQIRRRNAIGVAVVMIILIILVAAGAASRQLTDAANVVITAAIPVAIVGGLLRLLRMLGVTLQAVAGALAVYLSVGLLFAGSSTSSPIPAPRSTSRSTQTAPRETACTSASPF